MRCQHALQTLLILIGLGVSSQTAPADPLRDLRAGQRGQILFQSLTPTGPTELMARQSPEATIAGVLTFPENSQATSPAMIIMHGSGGIIPGREGAWAERLNRMGVATFVVDSFTPRGFSATGDDQSRLPLAASIADALSALQLLATHPGIDPNRIGIMGFSKGGQLALYTTLEPFRRAVIRDDVHFALHIAFYASCSIPYLAEQTTKAPILFLLGREDDFTPADHCRRYAAFFEQKGSPIEFHVLDGAHHGFDLPTPLKFLPRAQTARNCGLDIILEPEVTAQRWDTGTLIAPMEIKPYLRTCMQRGASYGGNTEALAVAIDQVSKSILRYLKPDH
ncbi:dienelactone hydrolase [Microvirga brassicacearum]|uniref:Dienelactone hydrolase n=2 Tax=Microvirga brassicacearum TaxID=2580413 RepID=A0A5N3P5X3_9HYPH|nr:dienelactone hydrolase [Microvirga brassicacearum]